MRKPSVKKAYTEMNIEASDVFMEKHGINVVAMDGLDDYLYYMEMPEDVDEDELMEASNEFFHGICVLDEEHELVLNEETEYAAVHRNEHSGKCFVLFNHPFVIDAKASGIEVGDTVKEFGDAQRAQIAAEEEEEDFNADSGEPGDEDDGDSTWMRQLTEDIKSGAIRSKSGEGFFVLKGEYYDAIEAGRKTTEYRDLTPRNLSLSIGIKTVKFQRGYGHPGQPPKQMRYEVKSVRLMDASDRECDPYTIPPGFLATTIAIHLGKRVG